MDLCVLFLQQSNESLSGFRYKFNFIYYQTHFVFNVIFITHIHSVITHMYYSLKRSKHIRRGKRVQLQDIRL